MVVQVVIFQDLDYIKMGAVTPPDLAARIALLQALDKQYGERAPLPLEEVDTLVASILSDRAIAADPDSAIAVGSWAIRHGVEITAPGYGIVRTHTGPAQVTLTGEPGELAAGELGTDAKAKA